MMERKILLALIAIATVVAAGYAQAQSNVSVYGRINVGIVNYAGYGADRGTITQENNLSSRFGFAGSEGLGAGMKAIFTLESGFSADTGAGAIGNREATVGLQGDFGKLRLGYMLNALDDLHSIAGPGYLTNVTNDNLHGFWGNGFHNRFANNTVDRACTDDTTGNVGITSSFAFDNRYANSIRYDSPSFNGFNIATHLGLGEIAGCSAYAWSTKLQYQAGGVNTALAYNLHRNLRGRGLDDHILVMAAGYNIAPSSYVGAYYQTLQYGNPGRNSLRQDGFGVIGRGYFGPSTIELGWYHAGQGRGDQTPVFSGISVGAGTRANLLILGYRYAVSRRTELWSQIAQLRNGRNALYDIGGAGNVGEIGLAGRRLRALAAGLKHDF